MRFELKNLSDSELTTYLLKLVLFLICWVIHPIIQGDTMYEQRVPTILKNTEGEPSSKQATL